MKNVIVTGCADGIGFKTAELFYRKGYQVYGFDVQPMTKEVGIHFQIVDINEVESLKNYIEKLPNLDIVINSAAIQIEKKFVEQSLFDIDKVIQTNLVSLMKFTSLILPKLNMQSLIINVGSIHSTLPRLNKLPYDVSKAGLDMFTKGLALELAPKTRVIGLNIGATLTPMNQVFNDLKIVESALNKIPMHHIFKPIEIAKIIYQLTLPIFKYMTGSIVVYDGGRSLI